MVSKSHILKTSSIDYSKIVYDELESSKNGKYVVSKIWYTSDDNVQPVTLFFQTDLVSLYEVTKSNDIILQLLGKEQESFFEKIDEMSLTYAKEKCVTKKYKMKDAKYKTIINEIEIADDEKINALKLKASSETKHVHYFSMGNKTSKNFDDVKKLLTNGTKLKIIVEVDGLIIDVERNILFTSVILKQVFISKPKPLKLELAEYSFIDSESDHSENEMDLKNVVLNTQTEYLDQNTSAHNTQSKNKQDEHISDSEKSDDESDDDLEESESSLDVDKFISSIKKK